MADNRAYILNYLTATCKYNMAVACGILANIYKESAYKSTNLQQTGEKKLGWTDEQYTEKTDNGKYTKKKFINDGFGYGLIQWTYFSRKEALYNKTVAKGISIGNMDAQLAFMISEMKGYTKFMDAIKSAGNTETDAYNVAYAMCTIYEQPADMEKRGVERGNYAIELYRQLAPKRNYLTIDITDHAAESIRIRTALEALGYDCHLESK